MRARKLHDAVERGAEYLGCAGGVDGFDDDEQSGDEWKYTPTYFAHELDWIGAALNSRDDGDGDGCEASREAEVELECRGEDEDGGGEDDSEERCAADGSEMDVHDRTIASRVEIGAGETAKKNVRDENGCDGGKREHREPAHERRHVGVEDDEVGGVGNGQHETGGVGYEGAGEQIGHGPGLCVPDRCQYGGSEHDGGGVVGHEDGDGGSDQVDEREEAA